MSFRELKNFSDMLCLLDYPRIISIDNFREPNFFLVSEILCWLFERFDIELESHQLLDNEYDRILFIKNVIQSAAVKLHIKLNAKKLYQADGHAVQEIFKLVKLLFQSSSNTEDILKKKSEDEELSLAQNNVHLDAKESEVIKKINELKKIRYLSSEITQKGAKIFDLLNRENEIREERNSILQHPLQLNDAESKLRDALRTTQKDIETINFRIDNVAQDEASLDAKIERREQEHKRQQARLEQLRAIRPAHQDELELLEEQLQALYDEYVLKHRTMVYLEDQLEEFEKQEQEAIIQKAGQIKEMLKMQDDLDAFEFKPEDEDLQLEITEEEDSQVLTTIKSSNRVPSASRRRLATSKARVFGSLTVDGLDDDESLDDSFNLVDNVRDDKIVNAEDNSDLDSEDELELMNLTKETPESNIKKITDKQILTESDDDF